MATVSEPRPDPDLLLVKVNRQLTKAQRGKLRIYFGSSAGVGKTFAMLLAARELRGEGADVVVGVVETHGRAEISALLDGLEMAPSKAVPQRGRILTDFDLDAALERPFDPDGPLFIDFSEHVETYRDTDRAPVFRDR